MNNQTPRILITSIFFAPEQIGISKYTTEMVEWLAQKDLEVRVVTAQPFYPQWRVYSGYTSWKYSSELLAGAKIVRCPLWVPSKVNGLSRIIHLLSYGISSSIALASYYLWKPDLVIAVMPPIVNLPSVVLLAKLSGSAAWLHIQDFELDLAKDLNIVPHVQWLYKWVFLFESFLLRQFQVVSTISHSMMLRLTDEKNVDSSQTFFLPNWIDVEQIYPLDSQNPLRTELEIAPTELVVLYSGNMGKKYGLEILAHLATEFASDANVKFIFCGDGAAKSELEQLCRDLLNVRFLALQPENRLNELLNLADVHLLPQKSGAAKSVMPSKLLGMLASGRPVVATAAADSEVCKIVENCGIVVPPEDLEGFTRAVRNLLHDEELRTVLGKRGRAIAIEQFSKESVLIKLEHELNRLLSTTI